MKKVIFVVFLYLVAFNCDAQILQSKYFGWFKIGIYSYPATMNFSNNNYEIEIDFFDDVPVEFKNIYLKNAGGHFIFNETGEYKIIFKDNIPYIEWNKSVFLKKYGILYHDQKIMFYIGNDCVFDSEYMGNASESFPFITEVEATSELVENRIVYSGKNIKTSESINGSLPWAEAVKGYGIGEKIKIEIFGYMDITGFLISNGYVDFNRIDLYKKNSRIKIIEITAPNGDRKEYELNDDGNFQYLVLPENMIQIYAGEAYNVKYTFIIKNIFPGDLWDDTCLNMIIPTTRLKYR